MDRFSKTDLQNLVEHESETAVSIYMPTVRSGREVRQNAIRFKNLLRQAGDQLSEPKRAMLKDLAKLEADDSFWQHQGDGLAIFASDAGVRRFRLPVEFPERCVVAHRFDVKPLLRLLQNDGQFYIIVVSQKSVRLFNGTHHSVSELHPENLPADLRSALRIDEYVSSLQHHTLGPPTTADRSGAQFHGHGGSDPDVKKKDEIQQFFYRIDEALRDFLRTENSPLVFAGVEYLFPLFRKACSYPHLLDDPVTGNFDDEDERSIHAQAWKKVQPVFQEQLEQARNEFAEKRASDRSLSDLEEIVPAARYGQVDTLFVRSGAEVWGIVENDSVHLAEKTEEGAAELVNLVAIDTLLNSGRVFVLDGESFPEDGSTAALLRSPRIVEK